MNKNDRRKLAAATRKYCSNIMQANNEYSKMIEDLRSKEEEKLDNLPESLQNGSQADNIEEALSTFDEVNDNIDVIEETCEAIADNVGIEITIADEIGDIESDGNQGKRNKRFQILLSEKLMKDLRWQAAKSGCSCNEIVCRALQAKLNPIEKKDKIMHSK